MKYNINKLFSKQKIKQNVNEFNIGFTLVILNGIILFYNKWPMKIGSCF